MSSRTFCTCGGEGSGEWIACDKEGCPVQWYHWECVGITELPVENWVCPQCRTSPTGSMRVNQIEEQAPPKRRKSQRITRVVYETTEASIFEHIIEESRATALAPRNEAKAQEAASAPDEEGRKAGLGEESAERILVRKMRAKFEKELIQGPDDTKANSSGMRVDANLDEPDGGPPLSIHEAASRLIILGAEESPSTVIQSMKNEENWHKVNFFDALPPSKER